MFESCRAHQPSLTLANDRELRLASHAKVVHHSAKREGGLIDAAVPELSFPVL